MNHSCMETATLELDTLREYIENSDYYPFLERGVLIPFLDDEELLYDFYLKANCKRELKQFCKRVNWEGKPSVPRVVDEPALMALLRSACNSYDARKKLEKYKNLLRFALLMIPLTYICSEL